MKKYFLIQCYNCEKRRRLMYQVQDTITNEMYHLTEEEWLAHKDDCYSYEETQIFRAELEARTYLQEVEKSKKRRRK